MDSSTNEPLAGVNVLATHGGWTRTGVSAADGRFGIEGIVSAELVLVFSLDGYRPLELSLPVEPLWREF